MTIDLTIIKKYVSFNAPDLQQAFAQDGNQISWKCGRINILHLTRCSMIYTTLVIQN